ncbi:tRNA (guanine-N(7)-)-methyltransferase non-catalytic subunit wdr4 [Vitis vinifera]|uniref:tRNA (Guanine-N(7)-)-methyltransferase non-catalytic subunit wdr4 n=1 Tax=Vitis vinifera TaxID=29760 RepID=A0A438KGZ2_VITVI|nr:tRNA (guanine-N(7)-)-methyltransferase non-catalytic subunit wdr4 [Vitis vinifera]
MEEPAIEEGDNHRDVEVAPALISVHPDHKFIVVSIGSDLRVFDLQGGCSVTLVDDSSGPLHKDSIRAIRFGAEGELFVSAGDDKLVKIWNANSWHCISTVCSEKRVSAVAISKDGLFVCFADKFGVVWALNLDGFDENQVLVDKKAAPVLAHYCSIITSLVSVFPKKPLDGAHEIQSFCLGHTEFVSCLAFVCAPDYPEGFLVSGSGDSTVRLWDITSGSLLDTCEVGSQAGFLESNGREEEHYSAVIDLCTTPDGIMLLNCNLSAKSLSIAKVVSITGGSFIPTSLGTASCAEFLWMVTGVSTLHGLDSHSLARVRVISGFRISSPDSVEHEPTMLEDDEIPGGEKLLEKLQGSVSIENKVFSAAAEAVKMAMCNLLIKKQYSADKREFRKRTRNDKKIKQ